MKSRYPLIKLLIYIIAGYIVGYLFILNVYLVITISLIAIITSIFTLISNSIKYSIVALLIGINLNSNVELYSTKTLNNKISNGFEGIYNAEVTEVLSVNKNYKRFIAEGEIYSSIFKDPHRCKSIVTLFDKNNKVVIKPGIEFISTSNFKVGAPKILKEDFNEKLYLISNKSLFYSITNANKFAIRSDKYNISTLLYDISSHIKSQINKAVPDSNIAGVIIALTTGDKSGIEKDTQESFSLTGTAHVLAISGLHVGIFSLLVFTIIGYMKSRLLKLIVFSTSIWFFIIFTGGHPSAVRAAIMATFVAFLIYYGKVPNPINILLFTVILYLLIEPTILYSISFQLSVFAISGIILLYKPIYETIRSLLVYENSLFKLVSSSFAISFAATIPTALLTAYFFNSFSTIYPIANLLVLPLMTFASFQSIFYVLLSTIGLPFSDLFAKTAYLVINLSLDINSYLSDLSQSFQLNNINLLLLSVGTSIMLMYLLTAINIRRFLFRMLVLSFAILLILRIDPSNHDRIILLPREQSTSLIVENDSSVYLIMADRKKYDYLYYDIALANHFINSNKRIKLLKSGNVSIYFEDNYLKNSNISSEFINIDQIDDISKRMKYRTIYRIDEKYD